MRYSEWLKRYENKYGHYSCADCDIRISGTSLSKINVNTDKSKYNFCCPECNGWMLWIPTHLYNVVMQEET